MFAMHLLKNHLKKCPLSSNIPPSPLPPPPPPPIPLQCDQPVDVGDCTDSDSELPSYIDLTSKRSPATQPVRIVYDVFFVCVQLPSNQDSVYQYI